MPGRTKFSHKGVYDWLDIYYCNARLYKKFSFYGKHSCFILVVLLFFSGKFTVCVHGIDNCVEMFQIITIYDDERVINVFGFNAMAQAYAKTLTDKVVLKDKLHVLH